jgi:hypothetical protein
VLKRCDKNASSDNTRLFKFYLYNVKVKIKYMLLYK